MPKSFAPFIVLALAVFQFFASAVARMTGHGQNIEDISFRNGLRPPEIPAGYAFSIWFVIFTLSVVYGAYHTFKAKDDALCRDMSRYAAPLFFLSSHWMITAQLAGDGWHLVLIITLMWVLAVRAFLYLHDNPAAASPVRTRVLEPLFGLYASWLSAAIFLNWSGTIGRAFGTFGLTPTAYALVALTPAAILASVMLWRSKGNLWFAGTSVWALTAVAVANLTADPVNHTMLVFCALAIAIIGAVTAFSRKKAISAR